MGIPNFEKTYYENLCGRMFQGLSVIEKNHSCNYLAKV